MGRSFGHRGPAVLAVCVALLAIPAVQAEAKKAVRTATKAVCADLSLPVPDGPTRGDFVAGLVSTGKRCPRKLICGYGGLPLGARVRDVNAKLRVTHPAVGDLTVLLVDPTGGLSTLTAGGVGGADFGAGPTGCTGAFTTFDDSGDVRPLQPLARHNGSFGSGDWRFYFDDTVAGNAGVVEAIGIRLTYRYVVRRKRS